MDYQDHSLIDKSKTEAHPWAQRSEYQLSQAVQHPQLCL